MPALPIFLFFSGLALGLFFGLVLKHFVRRGFAAHPPVKKSFPRGE